MFRDVPPAALQLGLAGLAPFIAGALGAWTLRPELAGWSVSALLLYAATIVSFLGAVHWGAALKDPAGPDPQRLVWSVLPALGAWLALLLGIVPGLVLLAVTLSLALLVDRRAVREGVFPAWYGRLRLPLTGVAVLSLAATLLAL